MYQVYRNMGLYTQTRYIYRKFPSGLSTHQQRGNVEHRILSMTGFGFGDCWIEWP